MAYAENTTVPTERSIAEPIAAEYASGCADQLLISGPNQTTINRVERI